MHTVLRRSIVDGASRAVVGDRIHRIIVVVVIVVDERSRRDQRRRTHGLAQRQQRWRRERHQSFADRAGRARRRANGESSVAAGARLLRRAVALRHGARRQRAGQLLFICCDQVTHFDVERSD